MLMTEIATLIVYSWVHEKGKNDKITQPL